MAFRENIEIRRFFRFIFFNLLICIAAYLLLISHELTNTYDGMWSGAEYRNYTWVVEIGRWFWPFVGKMQMNVCPEPFTSVLALLFFVAGSCVAAFWFGLKDSMRGYLLTASSLISTTVCVMLSHRYMSPVFGLSYLLSVTAAWELSKEKLRSWVASVLLLTLTLGLYQSNVGCACVLVLIYVICLLQNGTGAGKILGFIARALSSLVCSCVIYKIIWTLSLKLWHVEASSYRGGDTSVMKIITSFPKSFRNTYTEFYRFFFENSLKHNVYQRLMAFRIMLVCLAFVTLVLILKKMKHQPVGAKLCAVLCLLLIPPAANFALILAVENLGTSMQMTMPMITVFPFLLCVADSGGEAVSGGKADRWMQITAGLRSLIMLALLFGSLNMVSIDQHVMLASRENAVNMLNRVAVDLGEDTNPEGGIFFVGRPSDNPVFLKDQLWERSNDYAHYGEFWLGGNLTMMSYFGYLRDAGLTLTFNWDEASWDDVLSREEVQTMPIYPDDGYIMRVGKSMVVRFS